jgi:hypothetical protein
MFPYESHLHTQLIERRELESMSHQILEKHDIDLAGPAIEKFYENIRHRLRLFSALESNCTQQILDKKLW